MNVIYLRQQKAEEENSFLKIGFYFVQLDLVQYTLTNTGKIFHYSTYVFHNQTITWLEYKILL